MNWTIKNVLLGMTVIIFSGLSVMQLTSCNETATTDADAKDSAKQEQITDKKQVDNPFEKAKEANPFEQQKDPNAQQNAAPAGPTTAMKFDKMEHQFGQIKEGEKVETTFKFTNTGKEPLIISNAKGSCGCTVPKWPKEPLAPGETGEMLVSFDSKGKPGSQTKTVTITANTEPAVTRLTIKAEVEKKAEDASAAAPAN